MRTNTIYSSATMTSLNLLQRLTLFVRDLLVRLVSPKVVSPKFVSTKFVLCFGMAMVLTPNLSTRSIMNPDAVNADIVDIDPFIGTHSEDFNGFPGIADGVANTELDAFDEFALLTVNDGSLKLERISTRNGDTVFARSNPRMLLTFGIVDWTFDRPVSEFGAYFENNSDTNGGTIEFFDAQDQLLGTRTIETLASSQTWTWNGWRSDTPIARMTTRGNSDLFDNGFFFFEDAQLTAVPEPSTFSMLVGMMLIVIGRFRLKTFSAK